MAFLLPLHSVHASHGSQLWTPSAKLLPPCASTLNTIAQTSWPPKLLSQLLVDQGSDSGNTPFPTAFVINSEHRIFHPEFSSEDAREPKVDM
ncbi:hypothetical protein FJTKL_08663 [Diaporthe vaccinii]|uniref:Uncharacterized protein n=1 Tax=Diaporthe vaccinii TaxID=105482 RepID=A0ABR4EQX8_9PEZI